VQVWSRFEHWISDKQDGEAARLTPTVTGESNGLPLSFDLRFRDF